MRNLCVLAVAWLIASYSHAGSNSFVVATSKAANPVAVWIEVPADYVVVPLSISSDEKGALRKLDNIQETKSRLIAAAEKTGSIRIHHGAQSLSVSEDEGQLAYPWNRFARRTVEPDFAPHNRLDEATLAELFAWSAETFAERTAGSPIHRIGHERWLRNLAVALGNAPTSPTVLAALRMRANNASALVREHVEWALVQHEGGGEA